MWKPPAWMVQDDPSYDPNRIGAVSQAKVLTALIMAGKVVLAPCMSVRPYDYVIEDGEQFRKLTITPDDGSDEVVYDKLSRRSRLRVEDGVHVEVPGRVAIRRGTVMRDQPRPLQRRYLIWVIREQAHLLDIKRLQTFYGH